MGGIARRVLGVVIVLVIVVATIITMIGQFVAGADQRIVGGTRASVAEHPYVVYLTTSDGYQFCGGTLVSATKVVTAGHCARAFEPTSVRVVAGREDKESTAGVVVPVASAWVHPNYRDVVSGYDVAVLTLDQAVRYKPLPVARASQPYAATTPATILGWGRTSSGGTASRYLMQARVPLVADNDCAAAYKTYRADGMVCAGFKEGGVDTCQGDSGGPLVVDGVLAGISSWGEGCAEPNKPGVYTRVAAYSNEIAQQIGTAPPPPPNRLRLIDIP